MANVTTLFWEFVHALSATASSGGVDEFRRSPEYAALNEAIHAGRGLRLDASSIAPPAALLRCLEHDASEALPDGVLLRPDGTLEFRDVTALFRGVLEILDRIPPPQGGAGAADIGADATVAQRAREVLLTCVRAIEHWGVLDELCNSFGGKAVF